MKKDFELGLGIDNDTCYRLCLLSYKQKQVCNAAII